LSNTKVMLNKWDVRLTVEQSFELLRHDPRPLKDKYSPSLRPAGYINSENFHETWTNAYQLSGFLPEFIDKKELTYIASLGRKNAGNEKKEWNIETKSLTFTGLGAIAKFHYKNFAPPSKKGVYALQVKGLAK
jgi:hypothetical protein